MAQISTSFGRTFFVVEHLTFEYEVHSQSFEEHNEVDHISGAVRVSESQLASIEV